ncbi:MAG: hypothetical protein K0R17_928 [Rariglobus sp.]|jgi:hypothetical protein|nr:hypothetical protein [Rariglobus sp.]
MTEIRRPRPSILRLPVLRSIRPPLRPWLAINKWPKVKRQQAGADDVITTDDRAGEFLHHDDVQQVFSNEKTA